MDDGDVDANEGSVAVGLHLQPGQVNAVVGATRAALRAGLAVVVVAPSTVSEAGVEAVEDAGGKVVRYRFGENGDSATDRLVVASRKHGFTSVLYHRDPEMSIDYAVSLDQARTAAGYLVEAVPEFGANDGVTLVGIPAYNECERIGEVIAEAQQHADAVLVVDDGSDDDTAALARDAGAIVVRHDQNRGYGQSLRTLFEEANRYRVDHLVVLDADGQHDPADIPKLLAEQRENGANLVIASRFLSEGDVSMPRSRRLGLSIINRLFNAAVGDNGRNLLTDTQSGFRAYDRRTIQSLAETATLDDGMGASIDVLYHCCKRGFEISEVGTHISYDVDDPNSHNPFAHGIHVVRNIFQTIEQERPLQMLGIPSLVSLIIGIAFGYSSIINYINSGQFEYGLAISTTLFTVFGLVTLVLAIILHALALRGAKPS